MTNIELPSGRWRLQIRRKNLSVEEVYDTEAGAKKANKCSRAEPIDQPARYGVIEEKPLQTLIQTRNWVGEGGSAQVARDGQC